MGGASWHRPACMACVQVLARAPFPFTNPPPAAAPAAIGRLCEKCDGKCPICDSYVRPATLVRVCDECNYGSYEGRCVICGGIGVSDAYYCKECTLQEKDVSGAGPGVTYGAKVQGCMRACTQGIGASRAKPLPLPCIKLGLLTTMPLHLLVLPSVERWVPQDHQLRLSKNRSILRTKEVRVQKAVTPLLDWQAPGAGAAAAPAGSQSAAALWHGCGKASG